MTTDTFFIIELKEQCNKKRAKLLAETDWYVVRQAETGTAIPQKILDYRQALRDITSQEKYPHIVMWPTKPE